MNKQSPFSPDSVLSLVVFVLSLLLIFSNACLYYIQGEMTNVGAMISGAAKQSIDRLQLNRQLTKDLSDGDNDSVDEEVTPETPR